MGTGTEDTETQNTETSEPSDKNRFDEFVDSASDTISDASKSPFFDGVKGFFSSAGGVAKDTVNWFKERPSAQSNLGLAGLGLVGIFAGRSLGGLLGGGVVGGFVSTVLQIIAAIPLVLGGGRLLMEVWNNGATRPSNNISAPTVGTRQPEMGGPEVSGLEVISPEVEVDPEQLREKGPLMAGIRLAHDRIGEQLAYAESLEQRGRANALETRQLSEKMRADLNRYYNELEAGNMTPERQNLVEGLVLELLETENGRPMNSELRDIYRHGVLPKTERERLEEIFEDNPAIASMAVTNIIRQGNAQEAMRDMDPDGEITEPSIRQGIGKNSVDAIMRKFEHDGVLHGTNLGAYRDAVEQILGRYAEGMGVEFFPNAEVGTAPDYSGMDLAPLPDPADPDYESKIEESRRRNPLNTKVADDGIVDEGRKLAQSGVGKSDESELGGNVVAISDELLAAGRDNKKG